MRFFLLFAALWTECLASIKSCGGLFTITKVSLQPVKVRAGENVNLTLKYVSPIMITGGTVKNSVTYNFLPLIPMTTDLCRTIQCPLQAGEHDGSSSFTIPTGLSGSLTIKTEWLSSNDKLLCLSSTVTVS
jgi:hypothetical protein